MKKLELWFTALLVPLDLAGVILSVIVANGLRSYLDILPMGEDRISSTGLYFLIWYFPIIALFAAAHRLYLLSDLRHRVEQLFRLISSNASATMTLFMVVLFGRTVFVEERFPDWREWAYSTSLLTLFYLWISSVIIMVAFRWFYRVMINIMFKRELGIRRVLLIGDTEVSNTLMEAVKRDTSLGLRILGVIKTNGQPSLTENVLGSISDIPQIILSKKPDQIIAADPELPHEIVLEIIDAANDKHIDFTFAPNLFEVLATNVTVSNIGGIPLLNLRRTPLDGWGKILKRIMDIGISFVSLVLLSPLFVLVAVLIKIQDGGKVFYWQCRISEGQQFKMLKFRSMIKDADKLEDKLRAQANERQDGPLFKMKNDPRVTNIGKILRKSRLDELPQLWNVFKGDMSLIGPRPHLPKEIEMYQKHHRKVLAIKAGMTGLAQLSGSSDLSFEEEVRLDTYYIENWSLLHDLELLLKTPFIVIFKDRSGA